MCKHFSLKALLIFAAIFTANWANAQTVKELYVNLYTDSLKKGTFNYINIDGKLSNDRFAPLDTNQLKFTCNGGYFKGNSLWVPADFSGNSILVTATLKNDSTQFKQFLVPIKQLPDAERLRTTEEILSDLRAPKKKSKS